MVVESHDRENDNGDNDQKNGIVVNADVENAPARYQPAKWQSNITILSCVRPLFPSDLLNATDCLPVHCQLQRRLPKLPSQSHQCHFQTSAGLRWLFLRDEDAHQQFLAHRCYSGYRCPGLCLGYVLTTGRIAVYVVARGHWDIDVDGRAAGESIAKHAVVLCHCAWYHWFWSWG